MLEYNENGKVVRSFVAVGSGAQKKRECGRAESAGRICKGNIICQDQSTGFHGFQDACIREQLHRKEFPIWS